MWNFSLDFERGSRLASRHEDGREAQTIRTGHVALQSTISTVAKSENGNSRPRLRVKDETNIAACRRSQAGNPPDKHSVVGIGAGVSLPFVELQAPGEPYSGAGRGAIDEFASAHSDEAVLWANRLAAEEGLSHTHRAPSLSNS